MRQLADEIGAMRGGRLVEAGPAERVFTRPQDKHTRELLEAIPGQHLQA